jgi:putative membrane protein
MAEKQEQHESLTVKVSESQLASEYLANERTFLAWIRTSIAVISLGFVIAKFNVWLSQMAGNNGVGIPHVGASLPIGVAMMSFGGCMAILAYLRFNTVNRQIEAGEIQADKGLVGLVTLFVVALSVVVVIYVIRIPYVP